MRQRILEAALEVFAAQGSGLPVIDDFIKAAGVARGTFYNYYGSVDELLVATTAWLEEDLMAAIQHEMQDLGLTDPADRLTTGVRLWLRKAESDRVWCAFVSRSVTHGAVVEETLRLDLQDGQRGGSFVFESVPVARDLVVGTLHEAMRRMAVEDVPPAFVQEIARLVFRGLGMTSRRIEKALRRSLPEFRRDLQSVR